MFVDIITGGAKKEGQKGQLPSVPLPLNTPAALPQEKS